MTALTTETPKRAARRLSASAVRDGFIPQSLHEYRDADGKPLYWRIRLKHPNGDKWIRPMHVNGHGFELGEPPALPNGKPLYRLPELLAADPVVPVFVVEGERCADALARLGIVATTSGSCSSADAADWTPAKGRSVTVWQDNDGPGAGYGDAVVAKLRALQCDVRLVAREVAESVPEHGDCVDWLAAHPGATAADVRALPTVPAQADDGDDAPEPLVVATEAESYPLDALPVGIRAAVAEVQGFVQAPVPLVAGSALGALSLAAQSLMDVKRADKLHGPCGLFLLTVADSGERKTTCDGFFASAIRTFEAEQAEAAKPQRKDYRAELAAWESKQAGIKDALRAASKKGAPTGELQSKLTELERDKPEQPRVPRLIRGDETPEHLAWLLAKDWPTGGVVSAEAGIVLGAHGMGRDTVMRNLALLNILWDGGSLSIGRKTSESFEVRGARLTVALQVQEATLRAFFDQSGALARGSGFLARFLIAWPASTQGHRPFKDAPKNWPALAAFNDRLAMLLRMPQPLTEEWTLEPPLVAFTPEARTAWVAFHDAVESELGTGGELHDVRDVAAKVADNAARLAALFHMYTGEQGAISAECFGGASRIAAWHLSEARRFFGELALPPELADAVRLERWLVDYCHEHAAQSVPRREAQRAGPVRDAERLADALDVLAESNRVHERSEGRRKLIELHAALLREVLP